MRLCLLLFLCCTCAHAGVVNKCVTPEGKITFSDKSCADNAVRQPIGGNVSSYSSGEVNSNQQGFLAARPASAPPAARARAATPSSAPAPAPAPAPHMSSGY